MLSQLSINSGTQIIIPVFVFHRGLTSSFAIPVLCFNPIPLLVSLFLFLFFVFKCNICSEKYFIQIFHFCFHVLGRRIVVLYGNRFYDDDDDDDDNNNNDNNNNNNNNNINNDHHHHHHHHNNNSNNNNMSLANSNESLSVYSFIVKRLSKGTKTQLNYRQLY